MDFYCHQASLAIELDGSQHYSEEALEYDRSRTAELEKCGIMVLRFTNRDIDNNFEGACQVIEQEIKERADRPFFLLRHKFPKLDILLHWRYIE